MPQREGENGYRIPSGCAVSAILSKTGERISGEAIIQSIAVMHERSNGLGGGFAAYGIYPEYRELYALHIFYDTIAAKEQTEHFLDRHFDIANLSKIPTRMIRAITDEPLIWRYSVKPLPTKMWESQLGEDEFTARCGSPWKRAPSSAQSPPASPGTHSAALSQSCRRS